MLCIHYGVAFDQCLEGGYWSVCSQGNTMTQTPTVAVNRRVDDVPGNFQMHTALIGIRNKGLNSGCTVDDLIVPYLSGQGIATNGTLAVHDLNATVPGALDNAVGDAPIKAATTVGAPKPHFNADEVPHGPPSSGFE